MELTPSTSEPRPRDNSSLSRTRNAGRTQPITPRVRQAIEHMVNDADDYQNAAAKAGLTTHALRLALGKPHVAAYLRAQVQVLRTAQGPRNIHRLCEIRDAANNMPAVNAIKVLEQLPDDAAARASAGSAAPGVTVRIVNLVQSPPNESGIKCLDIPAQ